LPRRFSAQDYVLSGIRAGQGAVVFVHGGRGVAARLLHLAAGAVSAGYACAMPLPPLAPDAGRYYAGAAIGGAIALTTGPIYLTGHSTGGHLNGAD
jgi:alpha-beta hydrolase superfamily lysophospholipase